MAGALQASARRLTAEQRRQQLYTVALELFAQRGYRATTMDDIAEAAGVTKPLLYQHFSSKRALYLELVDSIARELLSAIRDAVMRADGPRQQVELGFAAYFHLVVSREAEFRLLYGSWAWPRAQVAASSRNVPRVTPQSTRRRSGWRAGWPTWPGPACARCTQTDPDARHSHNSLISVRHRPHSSSTHAA